MSVSLEARYRAVRGATEALAAPLSPEDCTLQSMPDASPVKWHLAHTSWFFETLVLEAAVPGYKPFDPSFRVLFNSYYNSVGEQYARPGAGSSRGPGSTRSSPTGATSTAGSWRSSTSRAGTRRGSTRSSTSGCTTSSSTRSSC